MFTYLPSHFIGAYKVRIITFIDAYLPVYLIYLFTLITQPVAVLPVIIWIDVATFTLRYEKIKIWWAKSIEEVMGRKDE